MPPDTTLEDLGFLLQEQGRCLDELTNRSRGLSAENILLRERISSGIDSVVTKSSQRDSLLSMMMSGGKKRVEGDDILKKFKEENEMLLQQADLLANELNMANASIAERDTSIASLGRELLGLVEKTRRLMVEKKAWKADTLEKVVEIESLQIREKQSNSLRCELSATVKQLQSEVESTRADAEMLVSLTSRSSSEIEDLRATLLSKQNEVERLDEERRNMERDLFSVRRDAKACADFTNRLKELLRQDESQRDELLQKEKELREELCKSDVKQHKLQSKCDFFEKELDATAISHRENISTISSNLAKLEDQHAVEIQSKDNVIDKLRRAISHMENENSRIQREKQSLEQRCLSLTSLLDSIGNDHQIKFTETFNRANDAENRLERSTKEMRDLKKLIVQLETKIQTLQGEAGDKEAMMNRVQSRLKDELKTIVQQNDAHSSQVDSLKEDAKQAQKAHEKATHALQQETEERIREAEKKCENLAAISKVYQLKAKEGEELLEKQSLLHQTLLDEMVTEKKEQREEMEKVIRNEREVSTRLMTKTQELNSTISKLSAEHFLLKETHYMQTDKIQKLEQIVARGEVKLRTMTSNYCKLSDEQEHLIRKEAEAKRKLHETKVELMKATTQHI